MRRDCTLLCPLQSTQDGHRSVVRHFEQQNPDLALPWWLLNVRRPQYDLDQQRIRVHRIVFESKEVLCLLAYPMAFLDRNLREQAVRHREQCGSEGCPSTSNHLQTVSLPRTNPRLLERCRSPMLSDHHAQAMVAITRRDHLLGAM